MTLFCLDSCSIIYLKKAGILSRFCSSFKCITTSVIMDEIGISLTNIETKNVDEVDIFSGEDTLFQIEESEGRLIFVSDDRRFINMCKRRGKLVINSLLVPILIYEKCKDFSFQDVIVKMDEIYSLGYYSQKVYSFALQIFFERKYWLNCLFPHLRL